LSWDAVRAQNVERPTFAPWISRTEISSLCLLLLVMQRDDGFHSGGAYRRDEARNGCD